MNTTHHAIAIDTAAVQSARPMSKLAARTARLALSEAIRCADESATAAAARCCLETALAAARRLADGGALAAADRSAVNECLARMAARGWR